MIPNFHLQPAAWFCLRVRQSPQPWLALHRLGNSTMQSSSSPLQRLILLMIGLTMFVHGQLLAQTPGASVSRLAEQPASLTESEQPPSLPHSSDLAWARNSLPIKAAIKSLALPHSESIIRFLGNRNSLGTIVTKEGHAIAKRSELDQQRIVCELADGRKCRGKIIATHQAFDLALIKLELTELVPIEFPEKIRLPTTGDLLITPGWRGEAIGIGLVSVDHPRILAQQSPDSQRIDMGVKFNSVIESKTISVDGVYSQLLGVRVLRVEPRSVGEKANLLIDDLICTINGKAISSTQSWHESIGAIAPGQSLTLEFIRNAKRYQVSVQTFSQAQRTIHDRWGGGPFSNIRFELSPIFIHDTVLRPEDCGGPIINLDGQVVGINIARGLRVASFSIPILDVRTWIERVVPNSQVLDTSR